MFTHRFLKIGFPIFLIILAVYSAIMFPFVGLPVLGGVILNGILGGFSGKVGPVVGANWKSIDYMRTYVIPENPNTDAQILVRAKFAKLVLLARGLLSSIIQPFWDPYYSNMSGFNAFFQANYSTLDGSNDLVATSEITKGTLETLHENTATYNTLSGVISCTYDAAISGNGLSTDLVGIVVYDKNLETFHVDITGQLRADGSATTTWLNGKTATNLIAYVFAFRGTGAALVVSDSIGDVCAAV